MLLCAQALAQRCTVLPFQNLMEAMPYPLRDRRRYRVSNSVIAEAVDAVRLLFVKAPWPGPINRKSLDAFNFVWRKATDTPFGIPDVIPRPICSCMSS